jgi:Tfp pilus assembly protein PilX
VLIDIKNRLTRGHKPRSGAALLLVIFMIAIVTLMVVNVLDTTTLELSALRNSLDYERALYLCNAGVQEVAAKLEFDNTWRGTISDGAYPADNTFEVTAVDGPNSTVNVTSLGVSGDATRTVQAIIEL